MKVEIRQIEKERFHGVKGKDSITRTKKYSPTVNPRTMKYETGLEKKDIEWLNSPDRMPHVDFSNNYTRDIPHPYWSDFNSALVLEANTMILDMDNPRDFIQVKLAKVDKHVANSKEEYNEGLWPEATHIIYDESEEIEVRASLVATKLEVNNKLAKMSLENKMAVLTLATKKSYKNNSENFYVAELDKEVNDNPEKMLQIVKYTKEDLNLRSLVVEGLFKNRLFTEGHKIKYQEYVLGSDVESVVAYLKDPENNEFKARLITDIKAG